TVVFTETGLLVGFFLPGDSLMVTAGLLASQGFLNVYLMGVILSIAAIAGDSVGYAIGKATGPRIFTRENSLLFNKKHLHRARAFHADHSNVRACCGWRRRNALPHVRHVQFAWRHWMGVVNAVHWILPGSYGPRCEQAHRCDHPGSDLLVYLAGLHQLAARARRIPGAARQHRAVRRMALSEARHGIRTS